MQFGSRSARAAAIASLVAGIAVADARGQATEQWQMLPAVGTTTQRFGNVLVVKGDVMIVGTPYEDTNGADSGAVVYYLRDATTGAWNFVQQIFPSDPEAGARFGAALDFDGSVLVVGAPYKDSSQGTDGGVIYVFRFASGTGTWSQEQKITPSVGIAGDRFGWSVAVSGTLAVAGAPYADTTLGGDSGVAFAYRYKNSFLKWVEEKQCLDSNGVGGDNAGFATAIQGSNVLIASPSSRETSLYGAGSIAVWSVSGSTWTQGTDLTAPVPQSYAQFGTALRVAGDQLAVTAPNEDEAPFTDCGAVHLFELASGVYVAETRFIDPSPASYTYWGSDAAMESDLVVIGAHTEDVSSQTDCGSAFLFRKAKNGAWVYDDQLAASDLAASDRFGFQVALTNEHILVAADGNDTTYGSDSGVIYGFDRDEVILSITPSQPAAGATITFSAFRGFPGATSMITIEDVDGIPLFIPLVIYVYSGDHTFTFDVPAPDPLYGVTVGMRAYEISPTGPVVFSDLAFVDV